MKTPRHIKFALFIALTLALVSSGVTAADKLVQWEVTMADMLSQAGYATSAFGKWHLGHTEGRFPTDQGFGERSKRSVTEPKWEPNNRDGCE